MKIKIGTQQKTGRTVQFEITADAWLERRGGGVDNNAFLSRVNAAGHLSTHQYARLVDEWVTAIDSGCISAEF